MRVASLLAIGLVAGLYLLVNISYFAVVSKADMLSSGQMTGWVFPKFKHDLILIASLLEHYSSVTYLVPLSIE